MNVPLSVRSLAVEKRLSLVVDPAEPSPEGGRVSLVDPKLMLGEKA